MFSDCSTMIIVWPRARSSSTSSSIRCTTIGASPSDSSSMMSTSGLWMQDPGEREHLLLAAREAARQLLLALPQLGEELQHLGDASRRPRPCRPRSSHALTARFWSTVRLGNTPLPPGSDTIPSFTRCLGRDVGDVAAVEPHHAAFGHLEPADHAQDRRLARAVRAEQRDALAVRDLEVHVEQDLHGAVREVDVRDLERRRRLAELAALAVLVLLLEQLLDDEREVAADEPRAVHQQQAADDARRHADRDDGAADADRVREEARRARRRGTRR